MLQLSSTCLRRPSPAVGGGSVESGPIKVLYCFHRNNDDSKCEVAHTPLPIRSSKGPSGRAGHHDTGGARREQMAPKLATVAIVLAMALSILTAMTRAWSPIFGPQLLLLY